MSYFDLSPKKKEEANTIIQKGKTKILYSNWYGDGEYQYRHVILPKEFVPLLPGRLMTPNECKELGVCQSRGWEHYMFHKPEPHILLFRRDSEIGKGMEAQGNFKSQKPKEEEKQPLQ